MSPRWARKQKTCQEYTPSTLSSSHSCWQTNLDAGLKAGQNKEVVPDKLILADPELSHMRAKNLGLTASVAAAADTWGQGERVAVELS